MFRIEHIAIWVKDLEGMREFYSQYFGGISGEKYTNPRKGFSSYFLQFGDGARMELMHNDLIPDTKNDPIAQFTGLAHFAISLGSKEKVDEMTEKMRLAGFPVLDGPRHTGDGYYESAILDPEQNRIELTI
jgi:lactoylglutathione lyase